MRSIQMWRLAGPDTHRPVSDAPDPAVEDGAPALHGGDVVWLVQHHPGHRLGQGEVWERQVGGRGVVDLVEGEGCEAEVRQTS